MPRSFRLRDLGSGHGFRRAHSLRIRKEDGINIGSVLVSFYLTEREGRMRISRRGFRKTHDVACAKGI